jgi:hypothetical protein
MRDVFEICKGIWLKRCNLVVVEVPAKHSSNCQKGTSVSFLFGRVCHAKHSSPQKPT